MRISWRRTITAIIVALFVIVTGVLGWTIFNYNAQIRKNVEEQNRNALSHWASYTEASLNNLYGQIYELVLTIYNNTELSVGSPVMQYATKTKCLDMMSAKLTANEFADCFCIYDMDSGLTLFSCNSRISGKKSTQDFKAMVLREVQTRYSNLNNHTWDVIHMDQNVYFYKALHLGKYVVATLTGANHYMIDRLFTVSGDDFSMELVNEEGVLHVTGTDDRSGIIPDRDIEVFLKSNRKLIFVEDEVQNIDAQFLLSSNTEDFFSRAAALDMLTLAIIFCFILVTFLAIVLVRMVVRPTEKLLNANQEIASGNIDYRIEQIPESQEFEVLYNSFNEMASQIRTLRIESYDRKIQDQENQLRMMRAQIRPHFYLNAITTVSNLSYGDRGEDIRAFCMFLSKYMRYMLNVESNWTTIGEELTHIGNYIDMQRIRFPNSVNLAVDCDDEIMNVRIPMLLLFTVVENAFKHAMSGYECLEIVIFGEMLEEENFSGCLLTAIDNGPGFTPEVLKQFSRENTEQIISKEHLGLTNIKHTLSLCYQRDDLLEISNMEEGGACVKLRIPAGEIKEEV